MSHASDERFKELAIKFVSFECSAEEKAELRRIIDQEPARREELQKLCVSVGIARELLPLANALEATEGRMSIGELEVFKSELARRREQKKSQGSGSRSKQDFMSKKKDGDARVIDVEPESSGSGNSTQRSKPRARSPFRSPLRLGIALGVVALLLWLLSRGCAGSLRWKFALVQPVLDRSEAQIAPLRSYLRRHFSNVTIELIESNGREMRDFESSKTANMVQVKCILEGVRVHPSWLVARFEVKGWRETGAEFQKTFPVENGNWTKALEEVRQFVRDY